MANTTAVQVLECIEGPQSEQRWRLHLYLWAGSIDFCAFSLLEGLCLCANFNGRRTAKMCAVKVKLKQTQERIKCQFDPLKACINTTRVTAFLFTKFASLSILAKRDEILAKLGERFLSILTIIWHDYDKEIYSLLYHNIIFLILQQYPSKLLPETQYNRSHNYYIQNIII